VGQQTFHSSVPQADSCLSCTATIFSQQVPSIEGDIIFDLQVANCGTASLNVFGEMYPTIGDCQNGTQYDLNLNKLITSGLAPGASFTGHYFYHVTNVSALGLSLCALNFSVGPAINHWLASCCDEFYFYDPWGIAAGAPNVTWGTEWLERHDTDMPLPKVTRLAGNYPNPFNSTTTIIFDLASPGEVGLKVYNLLGQEVETLIDGVMEAGSHSIAWDASHCASGIYFYKLVAIEKTFVERMTLLK